MNGIKKNSMFCLVGANYPVKKRLVGEMFLATQVFDNCIVGVSSGGVQYLFVRGSDEVEPQRRS